MFTHYKIDNESLSFHLAISHQCCHCYSSLTQKSSQQFNGIKYVHLRNYVQEAKDMQSIKNNPLFSPTNVLSCFRVQQISFPENENAVSSHYRNHKTHKSGFFFKVDGATAWSGVESYVKPPDEKNCSCYSYIAQIAPISCSTL